MHSGPIPTFESFLNRRAHESLIEGIKEYVSGVEVRAGREVDRDSSGYHAACGDFEKIERAINRILGKVVDGGKLANISLSAPSYPKKLELRFTVLHGADRQKKWKEEYYKTQKKLPKGRHEAKLAWEISELYRWASEPAQEITKVLIEAGLSADNVTSGMTYDNDGVSTTTSLYYSL